MNYFQTEKIADGVFALKFTLEGLRDLGQLWYFIPRVIEGQTILEGSGLATVQATTKLKSLLSPISGIVAEINQDIVNRADEITEATTLFKVKVNNKDVRQMLGV
jgi:glycine cleavage system H lipoate-binding protein